jgi:hypothetical protein
MSKFFSRIGTTKKDMYIHILVKNLHTEVKDKGTFTIQWIRGRSKDETPIFEVDPQSKTGIINHEFGKVADIYRDEKKGVYLSKEV